MRRCRPTIDSYHALDGRFRTGVAKASGNPLLLESIERARAGFPTRANSLRLNADRSDLPACWAWNRGPLWGRITAP